LTQNLIPLGFYNLNKNSLIFAELSAYAAALDELFAKIDEVEKECFLGTATGFGLDNMERILGSPQKDLPVQARREMLIKRISITENNFTKLGIINSIIASGMRTEIEETPTEEKLHIKCTEILKPLQSNLQYIRSAMEFLPAHIEATFDFPKT
jgi:hypothetical protein